MSSSWIEVTPNTSPFGNSLGCAMNSNGQVMALLKGNLLYISLDYGYQWNYYTFTSSLSCVTINSTGQYIACAGNGFVSISNDYGSSFINNATTFGIIGNIAMNTTGEYIGITNFYDANSTTASGIYLSNDYGNTFISKPSSTYFNNNSLSGLSISSNGQIISTAGLNYGIYISINGGVSFSVYISQNYWTDVAMSSTGLYIAACDYHGGIYISKNTGETFTLSNAPTSVPSSNTFWSSISMSSTGQYVVANSSSLGLYISTDYGETYNVLSTIIGNPVAISLTGQYIISGIGGSSTHNLSIIFNNSSLQPPPPTPAPPIPLTITTNPTNVIEGEPFSISYSNPSNIVFNPNASHTINNSNMIINRNYVFNSDVVSAILLQNILDPTNSGVYGTINAFQGITIDTYNNIYISTVTSSSYCAIFKITNINTETTQSINVGLILLLNSSSSIPGSSYSFQKLESCNNIIYSIESINGGIYQLYPDFVKLDLTNIPSNVDIFAINNTYIAVIDITTTTLYLYINYNSTSILINQTISGLSSVSGLNFQDNSTLLYILDNNGSIYYIDVSLEILTLQFVFSINSYSNSTSGKIMFDPMYNLYVTATPSSVYKYVYNNNYNSTNPIIFQSSDLGSQYNFITLDNCSNVYVNCYNVLQVDNFAINIKLNFQNVIVYSSDVTQPNNTYSATINSDIDTVTSDTKYSATYYSDSVYSATNNATTTQSYATLTIKDITHNVTIPPFIINVYKNNSSVIVTPTTQDKSIQTFPNPIVAGEPAIIIYYNSKYLPKANHQYYLKNQLGKKVSNIFIADALNSDFTFNNVILTAGLNILSIYDKTSRTSGPAFSENVIKIDVSTVCFKEGTKILCYAKPEDKYIPIENLTDNLFIKTYKHGYKKIKYILKSQLINSSERTMNKLYVMSKTTFNGLTEDLYITGSHSVLKNTLTAKEESQMDKLLTAFKDIDYNRKIDGMHKLVACFDDRFQEYNEEGMFNIYHLVLEHDSVFQNYGIYANGLLTESTDELTLHRMTDFEIIHKGYKTMSDLNVKLSYQNNPRILNKIQKPLTNTNIDVEAIIQKKKYLEEQKELLQNNLIHREILVKKTYNKRKNKMNYTYKNKLYP